MPETTTKESRPAIILRHRGRSTQIPIYLGKFLRMFLYQNEWKVMPMAAVIAGLVAMVTRNMFFITMEGTLMSAFALTCVGIWNGCFNSIQVICRERDVVKREHRAGMHISSYIIAHQIYQALLCLLQTIITMYICRLVGVQFPEEGLFTRWMIVDLGITLFLVTYASDALALWISSLAHNTTAAMTIMPFILIFQLVFSGAMLSLPAWCSPFSDMTISRYGLTAMASQADYNKRPLVTLWGSVSRLRGTELSVTVTVGQVMDYLADENNPGVKELRETTFSRSYTADDLAGLLENAGMQDRVLARMAAELVFENLGQETADITFTIGEVVDFMLENRELQPERSRQITLSTTVGDVIDYFGEDKVHWQVQQMATEANYDPKYENSWENIASCWGALILMTVVCACLAMITLEFIDKDKR